MTLVAAGTGEFRTETDGIGEANVPVAALYGIQTVRAVAAYPPGAQILGEQHAFLSAYARVKQACAVVNRAFGEVTPAVADAIGVAAEEVADGKWSAHFPSPLLQGGGGVTTNMNVNEVLANRAGILLGGVAGEYSLVHPNDHVNRSQSTNDTYPTAAALATLQLAEGAAEALDSLAKAFDVKASEYVGVERLGRTCLRDALPVTVEDTHRAHAALIRRAQARLVASLTPLHDVPLGATAVGTGAGSPDGFGPKAIEVLAKLTHRQLRQDPNLFDALAHLDNFADVAHAVEAAAAAMARVASDLRLLSSGPNGGFNEVELPKISAGSSIMPGKSNPMIPEYVMQSHMEVQGRAYTATAAVNAGELELNVMDPVLFTSLWSALERVEQTAVLFETRCVRELQWNQEDVRENLEGSFLGKVELSRSEGYTNVAR